MKRGWSRSGFEEPGMGFLKESVKKLPMIAELVKERDKLLAVLSATNLNDPYKFFVPPGHFFPHCLRWTIFGGMRRRSSERFPGRSRASILEKQSSYSYCRSSSLTMPSCRLGR